MHGHDAGERLQLGAERLQKAAVCQEFLHIQHRSPESSLAVQQFAVGLHRVAAARSSHQHRIQISSTAFMLRIRSVANWRVSSSSPW